ncbi:MAG: hypothetical protein QXD03_04430 [Candidatus Anstonellales archaeon]
MFKRIFRKPFVKTLSVLAVVGTVAGQATTMSFLFFIGQPKMPKTLTKA